jgi:exopolysaccharide biosynthesis polyprenyl glycosylphosphotransferase
VTAVSGDSLESPKRIPGSVRPLDLSAANSRHGRGWLMRRFLVAADVCGLVMAFGLTEASFAGPAGSDAISAASELALFALSVPAWLLGAKLFGLYDRDEERAAHSTPDDLVRVFLLTTVGAFLLTHIVALTRMADPDLAKVTVFWASTIVFVTCARILARTIGRRHPEYQQKTVIVGAGDVGQLVARKLLHHDEYGIELVGFVDTNPRQRESFLEHLTVLGCVKQLPEIVREHKIERVVFAFSSDSHSELLPLIRVLRDSGVQVDVVPRLFEILGPKVDVHTVESLPLIGLPPVRLSRSSRAVKRAIDVAGSGVALILAAPFFPLIAFLVKRDSPGTVLFRQTRLGKDMRPFTLLKFRTMRPDTDDEAHRSFIAASMDRRVPVDGNGLYKLRRDDAVTRFGLWLRKTSLDELPQLINVLRGDMSLVGPRPCIPYETERFEAHHFDRFLVPAGLTGLWQTSARAHATFGEALDMDVLYAQSWSLGLDLLLLARTPLQLLRPTGTA